MAWRRVELLLVLTGTLLLVSVRGWERVSNSELLKFSESGQWSEPFSFTTDEDIDYEFHKGKILKESENIGMNEKIPEEAILEDEDISASSGDALQEAEGDDYDDYKDESFEVDGLATIEMVDPVTGHIDGKGSERSRQPSVKGGEFHVEFVDAPPRSWIGCTSSEEINVDCSEDSFQITLPSGRLSGILVLGSTNISVEDAPKSCGYHLIHHKNILTVHFTGCNVRQDVEDVYGVQLSAIVSRQTQVFHAFCVENAKFVAGEFPPTFDKRTKCSKPAPPNTIFPKPLMCGPRITASSTTTCKPAIVMPRKWFESTAVAPVTSAVPMKSNFRRLSPAKPHNCAVDVREQISCGQSGILPSDCEKNGCCMDMYKKNCYYPLDECTSDQHLVFAIRHNSAVIPVDPKKLFIPASPLCKPVIVNDEVAIFKIKLEDCGVHSYDVGDMKIYLTEVHSTVNALHLKYGTISRSDQLRFMVECRYRKHGNAAAGTSIASVGYMVKTSTSNLSSSIISSGLYDIELKIAKDHTYSSYYPTYHQPLQLLLGHPVHLELNLKSFDAPDAVILVNYCVAYPRTANNALVLIHEGCANPNDPTVSLLKVDNLPNSRHQKRFKVDAFQFMDQKTNAYLNEEIYFMCSAEVCIPSEKPCEQQCFDGNVLQGFKYTNRT